MGSFAEKLDEETFVRQFVEWMGQDGPRSERMRALVERILHESRPGEFEQFLERLEHTGAHWGYHPPDPLGQRLSLDVHREILEPGSGLDGVDLLPAGARLLFVGNHLSFSDANSFQYLLSAAGEPACARAMTAVVGPKVYLRPIRRTASLAFGTLKVPQSTSVASEEARMSLREVAKLSIQSLAEARARSAAGDRLVVFVEGSRSRTGAMQPALAAVARYLEFPDIRVVPFGIWGTEQLVPLGEDAPRPSVVRARIGPPLEAAAVLDACGRRRALAMDVIGLTIAEQLPPAYRGVYGEASEERARARDIATALRDAAR